MEKDAAVGPEAFYRPCKFSLQEVPATPASTAEAICFPWDASLLWLETDKNPEKEEAKAEQQGSTHSPTVLSHRETSEHFCNIL